MSGIPAGAGSLIGKRLGNYDVLALLALGGTAEIYLARMDGTAGFEKYVVVKSLHDHLADDPDFVKMFLDEARLAAVLDHSNIVQTMELGEQDGRYYMVMEFLAGLSLAMIVRRAADRIADGRMAVPLILNITAQAAAGLHYAHERLANGKPLNMVHRDISPQNLVVGWEGVVKIVDFGIARAEVRDTKTKAGTIKGKFAYMSPEQCVATNVDRRTDVFALGVIAHELLTGRRLFKRNSPYETYQAVLECNVAPPSSVNIEIDPALDPIIMKAVAKDKDARYPTAEAFGDALLAYLHQHGKSSAAGEIERFLDQHFQAEIEEHGERMRELIAGRAEISFDSWSDEDDKKAEARKSAESIDTNDLSIDQQSSDVALDQLVSRLSTESDAPNDDGPSPEKTRIEANPLELLKELDAKSNESRRDSIPSLPAPPIVAPTPLPASKQPNVPSGRFPDAAQLPTMISPTPPPAQPPQPVRSRNATKPDPAMAPTAAAPPLDLAKLVPPVGPHSATHAAIRPIDLDETVRGGQVEVVMRPSQPEPPPPVASSPYPVVRGRPFSTDLAPSAPVTHQRPRIPNTGPSAPSPTPSGMHINPASVMSPVGDGYPVGVDWDAAAAKRARALAPWQLVVLFVGALGLALLLTMIIAKIVR
ncbi:MAG TPA: serine/threonine-protein kinase [Kofleriaceae bacterium]|jgi:serine/threonine-protein kinase|nr:serine/threonine-protein kinase [Kofleriaceae bacterium]